MTNHLDLAIADMTNNPWPAVAKKRGVDPATLYNEQRDFWINYLRDHDPQSIEIFEDHYPKRIINPDRTPVPADVKAAIRDLEPTPDMVNHPPHYTGDPSGVECIQITRHRNFNIGNAIKYLWRAGKKQDPEKAALAKEIEDLKKAVWYITDEITRLENLNAG